MKCAKNDIILSMADNRSFRSRIRKNAGIARFTRILANAATAGLRTLI